MQYRFTTNYQSGAGQWSKGSVAEFDADTAAWMLRDVPGCIEPVETKRAADKPANDRQVKAAPRKRGA